MATYEQLNTIVMQQHNDNEYSDKHKTPQQFDFQVWSSNNKGEQLMDKERWRSQVEMSETLLK